MKTAIKILTDNGYFKKNIYEEDRAYALLISMQEYAEQAFKESRRQYDWAGGHLYGTKEEEEDLTDFKYTTYENYLKDLNKE